MIYFYSTSYFPGCDKTSNIYVRTSHVAATAPRLLIKISVLVDNHRLQTYTEESG